MRKLVAYLDPKLDRYRPKKVAPKFTPRNLAEFIDVVRRTPRDILSAKDRARLSAVMSFDERIVRDLMIPKKDIVFVYENDFLGPLTLDKLYKSGFTHFPVIDMKDHVKGIIHTEALNALEIKTADRASKYLDEKVYYLHETDSLDFAVAEFLRTNYFYYLVLDQKEELVGLLTIDRVLAFLLGDNSEK